jgi:hypothetical protein
MSAAEIAAAGGIMSKRNKGVGTVVTAFPAGNPAKLVSALEAENVELRHTLAELALQTAILRERLETR